MRASLALDWAERNAARAKRVWPAAVLARRFQRACRQEVDGVLHAAQAA